MTYLEGLVELKNERSVMKQTETNSTHGFLLYIRVKALVAISEVTKENIKKDGDFLPIYDRLLVISVGTGSNKREEKYNAKMASKWGAICWLYNDSHTPLIDCYSEASKDLVDFYNCVVFQALRSENNYLRVHVC